MLSERPAPQRVTQGRLLLDHSTGSGSGLEGYLDIGGYSLLSEVAKAPDTRKELDVLEASGLRGRAGGGFPTAAKWRQAACVAGQKYFVCNAHSGQPGGQKEGFIINANPHRVLEASAFGAAVIGADVAIIYLGKTHEHEQALLEQAVEDARAHKLLGSGTGNPDVLIYRSTGGYITGEETALLEVIEGRPGMPRRKPPMPTKSGLHGAPTVIDNIETVLQAFYAYRYGAEQFREIGTKYCTGTLIFSLGGDVERTGLYELPLGTTLRTLINDYGGGVKDSKQFKGALVGGVSGTMLDTSHLDTPLDYDNIHMLGGDLASGVVMIVSETTSMVDIAREMAVFYHDSSCGKCQPCKDGTWRVLYMLNNINQLNLKSIDWAGIKRPSTKREISLTLLNEQAQERTGISYTDTGTGLDKIRLLCRWYEHRGDCHFSAEAARAILSLLDIFPDEFEIASTAP